MTDTPLTATPAEVELPTAPAGPPSNGGDDLRGQLAKAVDEIATLKAERARETAEQEQALAEARLNTAAGIAKAPATRINCAQQDISFDKAIASVGGRAFFAKLTPAQQAEALGIQGADTPLKTVKQYFGPGSDSRAANGLAQSNPAEYKRLRGLAKIHGIL